MSKLTPFPDAEKASVNSLFGVANQTLRGFEQLAALNLQATKVMLNEFAEVIRASLSEKNPADLAKLQLAAWQAASEKALTYGRQVKEILDSAFGDVTKASKQVSDAVEANIAKFTAAARRSTPATIDA